MLLEKPVRHSLSAARKSVLLTLACRITAKRLWAVLLMLLMGR